MSDEGNKTTTTEPDKITLESKGDWATLIEDEGLKANSEVVSFESVDALASDYLKLKTKLSSETSVKPLSDEATNEDYLKTSEAMLNVKEDSYSEDFKHKDLAFKYKLPHKLVEPFMKEVQEGGEKISAKTKEETLAKYKEQIKDKVPEEVFDTRFDAGLKALGFTREQYRETLPELERNKPELVVAITKLGEQQYTNRQKDIIDGAKTDLPTDLGVLKTNIASLAAQRLEARLAKRDTFHIEDKLKTIKLQYETILKSKRAASSNSLAI